MSPLRFSSGSHKCDWNYPPVLSSYLCRIPKSDMMKCLTKYCAYRVQILQIAKLNSIVDGPLYDK